MKNYFEQLDYFKKTILTRINQIEDATGEMFHECYPDLFSEHVNCLDMDSKHLYKRFKFKLDRLVDQLNMDQ